MQCLDEAEITLPVKDQSTVLPIPDRTVARPKKRVLVEETSDGSSSKKQKTSKNPYIDDEADCSDDNLNNDNESGAAQVNDAVKTKEAAVDHGKRVDAHSDSCGSRAA
ncbi:uncharacterized protein EV154DRAFT_567479 [Mucor mucedo]|uniref:uncharacterized protein n=1 Tax=Mucor mucedo TaxID=29922 RepID=UPI00221E4903|nr:uncharacterized protein EV154DRAFT_567479 [Mucor mucedo]KAI7887057.1 hypothetical protein EV154DRAFT_567479 [Mucor mucedo]